MRRRRHAFVYGLLPIVLSALAAKAGAQGRFVEDIQISRTDGQAEITIELACPMRFTADVPTQAGLLLEIRVSPFDSCRQLGLASGIASELYRPAGGRLAYLAEVEFESLGLGDSLLMLRFERPVRYRVSQGGGLRIVTLAIELADESDAVSSTPAAPVTEPTTEPAASVADSRPNASATGRTPMAPRTRSPGTLADYILNLQSTREPADPGVIGSIAIAAERQLYVSEAEVNGETWYRLRLGFFAAEGEAREALAQLKDQFPRAWIGRAEPEEVQLASSAEFEQGETVARSAEPVADPIIAAAPLGAGDGTLDQERILALMAEARDATLNQDFDNAVRIYTRLLQEPGDHRPEAREYLGVVREKNGQVAHARAEYRAYLQEYPGTEDTQRVEQRLNGLVTAAQAPRDPLRRSENLDDIGWDFASGVSQYYRRAANQFDEDQPEIVTLSALMTDVDFTARRTGGRFDMVGRVAVSHFYDLLDEDEGRRGDQERISYAYFDVADVQQDWSLRVGRQSLHNWGVLGRFDGAHFAYGWRPDQRVHFTTGHPVETTRNGVETDRQFLGVAVDFDQVIGDWDLSAFVNQQSFEGVDARLAVGTELRYIDERRSLTTLIDYDVDFGELNTILTLGTWRLANRMTFSALVDIRMSPVLTTRNALIGQPVTTIEELLLVWTEDEIRQLAADRTAQTRTFTFGLATPLGERFQINTDVTMTEIEGTVASGGVLAVPGTGQQVYLSTSLVGSGLFGTGDVSIISLRYGESDTFKTSYLTWDARFPIGRLIRINPRLRLAVREGLLDGTKRETINPSIRLLVNTRRHYRFELELGTDRFTRTDANGDSDSSGQYIDMGYRADF